MLVASSLVGADSVPAAPGDAAAPAAPAPIPAGISLAEYGGVCDGSTDNSAAITRGIADTKAKGVALLIPAGQCNFSSVIRLDSARIAGGGATSVLYATNWRQASIFMDGSAPGVSNVKLTGVAAPSRQSAWESTKIAIFGATGFVIDSVTIDGAPAASIQTAQAPSHGQITNSSISNSMADSIHLTGGASYITVENNVIQNSGDDGIAVVSYGRDASAVNNITARNNIVRNNRWGRSMSVVGGRSILYENNLLQNNPNQACVYIAQESGYATQGVDTVTVQRNTMENCGRITSSHGAVLVYSDGGAPIYNVTILSNVISQQGQNGINAYNPYTYGLRIENNLISGAIPALSITTPGATVVPYTGGPVGYVPP